MKNPPISSVIAATCALLFTALPASAAEPENAKPWRGIASGSESAIEKETQLVIQTPDQWRKWWTKHTSNQLDSANSNEPPKVDFEKESILVATLGMRSTGGHMVDFSEVRRDGASLKVVVKVTSPGPDDMVTKALTHPFAVIAIPKHDGPIEFIVR